MKAKRAGRYQLIGEPFVGGFGRGFVATCATAPGKYFFVKFPKDPANREHVRRLRAEAKALAAVTHPNVLRLVDQQIEHEPPFIVMDYLPGGTLRQLMQQPVPLQSALTMLLQIADALAAFHAHGGFHRDVTPSNILLTGAGAYVLADAGLANVPTPASAGTATIAGTPGYVDPWAVNNGYDHAADVWSLAVTFCEAITGRAAAGVSPHGSLNLRPEEFPIGDVVLRAHVHHLMACMLSPNRAQRPSAETVRQYAHALLSGQVPPSIGPTPVPPRAAPPVMAQPSGPEVLLQVFAVAALTVLVVIAVVGIAKSVRSAA